MAKITIETEAAAVREILMAALESLLGKIPRSKQISVVLEVVGVSGPLTASEESLVESLHKSDPKIFGVAVKEARTELGISQERLAMLIGYKDNTIISRMEVGDRMLPSRAIGELLRVLPSLESKLRFCGLIPSDVPEE